MIDKIIAIIPFTIEFNKELNSPNPESEIGPTTRIAIPPPIIIRIHIKNINPKSCP